MRIIIFGDGSGSAIKRKNTSIGIVSEFGNILIDVPKTISWIYEKDDNFIKKLKYVIITHEHHDHFGDIEAIAIQKEFIEKKELKIIVGPDVNIPILPKQEKRYIKVIKTKEMKDENINVILFPVKHLNIETYGVKVYAENKCVGYSSDTENVVLDKLKKCDVIFHDCAGGIHTSEKVVYDEAKKLNIVNKVYAIHVTDEFQPKYLKQFQ